MIKTSLQVVEKSSEEAQLIQQYVKNTHAATHNTYTLEVEEVRRKSTFLFFKEMYLKKE